MTNMIARRRVAQTPPRKTARMPLFKKRARRLKRSRSILRRARAWSSSAIAFSVRIRSMTADSLAVMSETNAATAPRKNVGLSRSIRFQITAVRQE